MKLSEEETAGKREGLRKANPTWFKCKEAVWVNFFGSSDRFGRMTPTGRIKYFLFFVFLLKGGSVN